MRNQVLYFHPIFSFQCKTVKSFCCLPWNSSGTSILFPSCMILFCTFSSSDVGTLGKSIQKLKYLSSHLVWCQQKTECWTKLNCDPLYALIQKNNLTEATGSCKIHQMQFRHLLEPKSLNCIWKCLGGGGRKVCLKYLYASKGISSFKIWYWHAWP